MDIRFFNSDTDLSIPEGNGPVQLSDGLGGWSEVSRRGRRPMTDFTGPASVKMDIPLLLDGFRADRNVQPLLDRLIALAQGEPPPVVQLTGRFPIAVEGRRWVVTNITFGNTERNRQGDLVRQEATVQVMEYVALDSVQFKRIPKKAVIVGSFREVYRTKQGDTLNKIAVKLYNGNRKKAKAIGKANGIRDVNKKLKAGRTLTIPR